MQVSFFFFKQKNKLLTSNFRTIEVYKIGLKAQQWKKIDYLILRDGGIGMQSIN